MTTADLLKFIARMDHRERDCCMLQDKRGASFYPLAHFRDGFILVIAVPGFERIMAMSFEDDFR